MTEAQGARLRAAKKDRTALALWAVRLTPLPFCASIPEKTFRGLGWVKVCVVLAAAMLGRAQQPLAFPHNTHMKMGLDCVDCHIGADTRAAAGIPSVNKCMLCHAKLGRDKAGVKKVIEYANQKIEIPWQRVYGFEPSAHVKFKHAPHFRAGVGCATCHGDMTNATVAEKLVNHNMGTCLACHRQKNASEDCAACHY